MDSNIFTRSWDQLVCVSLANTTAHTGGDHMVQVARAAPRLQDLHCCSWYMVGLRPYSSWPVWLSWSLPTWIKPGFIRERGTTAILRTLTLHVEMSDLTHSDIACGDEWCFWTANWRRVRIAVTIYGSVYRHILLHLQQWLCIAVTIGTSY
jgi:hypothetical protein